MRQFFLIMFIVLMGFGYSCKRHHLDDAENHLSPLVSEKSFDSLFPHRNALYTYNGFLKATEEYPDFLGEGTKKVKENELAAFLANIAQETTGGWPTAPGGPLVWGLYFTEEQSCKNGECPQYNSPGRSSFVAVHGKNYYGRGAMQISFVYNYGEAGKDLDLPLLDKPELLSHDPVIAFETAIWFWMRAVNGKPSCHDIMIGKWQPSDDDKKLNRKPGFGMVINVINGGLECSPDRTPEAETKALGRIDFYKYFTAKFHIQPDANCDCQDMGNYPLN